MAGIALAVAVVVGAIGSRDATQRSITAAAQAETGDADLIAAPIGGIDTLVSAERLELVRSLPGVARAAGVHTVDTMVGRDDRSRTRVRVVAGDPGELADHSGVERLEGRWPERDGEIVVATPLAGSLGLAVGDRVTTANDRTGDLTVVGIVGDAGAGSANRGLTALTTLATVARIDGGRAGYSRLRLQLADGVDARAWLATHEADLPPELVVLPADAVTRDVESVGSTVAAGLDLLAGATLFMGCLLAFHVNQVAAAAGHRSIGLLRTIGASRRDVTLLIAGEATVVAVGGVVLGGFGGALIGRTTAPIVARLLGLVPRPAAPPPTAYAVAIAATLAISAVSVLARRTWSVPPLAALAHAEDPPVASRRPLVLSLLALAVAVGLTVVPLVSSAASGFALLVISVWAGRNVFVWASGRSGRRPRPGRNAVRLLGARSIARDARMVGVSMGLVMATFAVVLATAVAQQATSATVDEILARQFRADLDVFQRTALPADAEDQLRSEPGVRDAAPLGFGRTRLAGADDRSPNVQLTAIDPGRYFTVSDFDWRPGDETARAALAEPGTVAVSEPLSERLGISSGSTITLDGTTGAVPLRVVGGFRSVQAFAVIGADEGRQHFGITQVHALEVVVEPGHLREVQAAITARWPDANVTDMAQIRADGRAQVLSLFGIGYASLLVAAALCTLGLGASLSASVIRREHELRLLRSIGTTRRQVVRLLLLETIGIVGIGFAAALPLGLALSHGVLEIFRSGLGTTIPFRVPVGFLVLYPVIIVPVSLAATLFPARRAARITLV